MYAHGLNIEIFSHIISIISIFITYGLLQIYISQYCKRKLLFSPSASFSIVYISLFYSV